MFQTILVQPLFNILFTIYGYIPGHDFGLAVIILTILVRLALWPLVTRQLHSQKAMQSLAPEIAKVKAKSKGDRQLETQLLMELYKDKGTSPFAPLLPILIQLPIFFALYMVFMDAMKPDRLARLAYDFVEQIPAVANVISNQAQFHPSLFGLVDLTKPSIAIALVAALAQYYQTKMMQPKNKPVDDQAKIMASMIIIFPILTFVIGLTLPSALALYWAVTSLVASFQQYVVLLRDAHEMEDVSTESSAAPQASAEPVAVTAGNPDGGRHRKRGKSKRKAHR